MTQQDAAQGGGLGTQAMEPALGQDPLSGTGGSSGGGTRAGEGDPSGGVTDDTPPDEEVLASPEGADEREIATEAAALGEADGSVAAAAGVGGGAGMTTMGDAIGAAAGMDVGQGTPGDKGGLGGGGASLEQDGGTGPAGSGSPGGNNGA